MSYEAELAVIGGMALDSDCAFTAAEALSTDMFQDADLARIFDKAEELYWKGKSVDAVVLCQELPEYTVQIMNAAEFLPRLSHFREYVKIVQDEWQWRQVEKCFSDLELSTGDLESKVGKLREIVDEQERILGERKEKGLESFVEASRAFLEWIKSSDRVDSFRCGYSGLDEALGGFMRGSVAVLAGRPGGGKTDFGINLAMRMTRRGAVVLYLSMEMTNIQLMQRVASSLTGINSTRVRDKELSEKEIDSVERVLKTFEISGKLHMVQEARIGTKRIRHYLELVHPDVVVIDHLGLMARPKADNPYKALGLVSNALKQLALEKNICILELVQMNRQIEGRTSKKPSLRDLRESGDIEQDADYVMFLIPEDLKEKEMDGDETATSTLYLEKNRHGRPGVFEFAWQPQFHRFSEIERRRGD